MREWLKARRELLMWAALIAVSGVLVAEVKSKRALRNTFQTTLERYTTAKAGMFVPPVPLPDLSDSVVHLGSASATGPQLVYFFTTTCPVCKASVPGWSALIEQTAGLPVHAVAASLDPDSSTRSYVAEHSMAGQVVVLPPGPLPTLYRVFRVPMLMLVDSTGRAAYVRIGLIGDQQGIDSVLAAIRHVTEPREEGQTAAKAGAT